MDNNIVSTTGAGDSFLAAVAWAYLNDYSIEKAAKVGIAASSITVKSKLTVSKDMSVENIKKYLKETGGRKWII